MGASGFIPNLPRAATRWGAQKFNKRGARGDGETPPGKMDKACREGFFGSADMQKISRAGSFDRFNASSANA